VQISKSSVLNAIREVPGITMNGLFGYFKCVKRNQEEKVKASVDKLLHECKIERHEEINSAYKLSPILAALARVEPFQFAHYIKKD
jgi:hypothetical protein